MDINNSSRFNNDSSMRGKGIDNFGYDLKTEKQEIEEITREVKQELLTKWKKTYANAEIFPAAIAAMHPDVVDFLLGFNLVSVYDNIAKQAGLDGKGRNALPQVVWQVAQEKKWDGVDQILQSKIALDPRIKASVLQLLEQKIFSKIRILSEKPFAKKENVSVVTEQKIRLSLAEALVQYPKLGEQSVTVNPLKLKYFELPMRPSIKNWITDFHDNMGAGKHGAVDRGNYLFHSENGKKLTPFERRKLSSMLKSLDENSPIAVDSEKQVVVFEGSANLASNQQQTMDNDNAQKDIFQRYALDTQKQKVESSFFQKSPLKPINTQEQKMKPSFFQRLSSKPTNIQEQKMKPTFSRGSLSKPNDQIRSQTKFEPREPFPSLQTEKVPEKKYFQKPAAKPATESGNYFNNFISSVVNQPLNVADPVHAPAPISAASKNIDTISSKNEDISTLSGSISFSSAQKFSNEKKIKQDSPWHIKPTESFSSGDDVEDKMNQAYEKSRNVVNLKE